MTDERRTIPIAAESAAVVSMYASEGTIHPRAVHGWGTAIQPFPGTLRQYCQLSVTYTESQPSLFEVKISRVEGTPPLLRAPAPGQVR